MHKDKKSTDSHGGLKKIIKIPIAMNILECSRNKIYTLIYSGKLVTVKIGGSIYITIESILKLQEPS